MHSHNLNHVSLSGLFHCFRSLKPISALLANFIGHSESRKLSLVKICHLFQKSRELRAHLLEFWCTRCRQWSYRIDRIWGEKRSSHAALTMRNVHISWDNVCIFGKLVFCLSGKFSVAYLDVTCHRCFMVEVRISEQFTSHKDIQ